MYFSNHLPSFFPLSWLITGVRQRVPLPEHKLRTQASTWDNNIILVGFVLHNPVLCFLNHYCLLSVFFVIIVFELQFLVTPLTSSNFSYNLNNLIWYKHTFVKDSYDIKAYKVIILHAMIKKLKLRKLRRTRGICILQFLDFKPESSDFKSQTIIFDIISARSDIGAGYKSLAWLFVHLVLYNV